MLPFLQDWLNLVLRWAHLAVGIGWIGTSFYFIALDLSLRKRERMNPGVYGTAWLVHGGGFYHVEKYTVAPPELPPDLGWYKWEAYLTWVTGFALLAVQYYFNASAFLIDPQVMRLTPVEAIAISAATLAGGWLAYNALCRSELGRDTTKLALALFALLMGAALLFTQVFSGRGAFIHIGALIGTIMAANVFLVIIPNQKVMVAQLLRGEAPDGRLGAEGKQRSLHNNYLTLPVLLFMVSNHYPMLYAHPQSWVIAGLIIVSGGLVRHFLNRHEAGDPLRGFAWTLPAGAAALAAAIVWTAPRRETGPVAEVSDQEALQVVSAHCTACHARRPRHEGFTEAPKGVALESVDELRRHAAQVYAQAVQSRVMPLGNETAMSEAERARLGAWIRAQ